MGNVLIVDDEFSIRKTVSLLLKAEGFVPFEAAGIDEALAYLDTQSIDLMITDLRLGMESGIDLLVKLQERGLNTESIIMTAFGTIETAVKAMRLGAYDYLTKPINPDELMLRVRKVLERKALQEEVRRLRQALDGREHIRSIVAASAAMQQVLDVVARIQERDIPVLITGETGTGKEVIAQALHRTSVRAEKPFVPINCCTLPEDILDSELFGHVKGAFTSANGNREGLFQQADGGTLFLDEVGDVSPRLQAKLLRALQEGEIRPVGGNNIIKVNVRVIAATNRDLEQMVEKGEFRSDLLFRLNVLPIHLPALRDRRDDILPLAWHFVHQLRERLGRDDLGLSSSAQEKLQQYDWPGNVRQLENIIERSFALFPGPVLDANQIIISTPGKALVSDVREEATLTIADLEARHIRAVLEANDHNQVAAARVLGISRSTLRRKMSQMM
ncbi:MAG: sigma-54 dependent transcriptional regulator [Sedimenticola sp.]|uniref:Sigma-54-dependent Fis family transcriptional regulator n=1 Tax=Sedimenticola thiotaurini TaxID=1543721 RepID=A0A558CEC3_9GAMM|nr:sigma-54 dependent transcriptional regulator [Sedimenticola sp.]TVT47129.1 MAG: sigma-54-dependent Fis family transcriptional regulator [Sedimenticola thiotaurini]MCW8946657.1 sigma-54 dependent transcriptional regulator [Sedimenticola sp.]MCW8974401.1 sigma-54 dependent transcriptional regulator [Sedimenticola sp.]MCW9021737.1 sigma-54 dependent transcriptional regulator [Sedimenticola sp.]